MNLGSFTKQPIDVTDYDVDYSQWLTSGDNVESARVSVTPDGLTVESIFVNDPKVKIWVSGGASGSKYKLTITTTTADGRVKQDEFKITVKDT
ncbi:MAG: hypothetical protein HRU77_01485 [Gammaproteobacteria bacterium]|nr:MAG: hypothetical protein HRU77_01485 [Gammaproteobacteria bacterium]